MMRATATVVFSVCCISAALGQAPHTGNPQDSSAGPYNVDEAYQVYKLLLPNEELYGTGTLVIKEETVPEVHRDDMGGFGSGPEDCVDPSVAVRFKDAIADYNRVNQQRWSLQRNFQLDRPYEIVNSDTLKVVFDHGGWDAFYKRYPGSGGFLIMSAVGFNKDKTRAIVYTGGSCGLLCGSWSFHLVEKVDGKWKEVPGVMCHTVS
jgi:hypothetical protein